ncbi:pilus assembly protein [Pelomonas aquatica]|uniref:VWFA domain-containing protein n=1 Tax=Pelomonas aquatica TaxID=431058 RepID=A0A9X4LG52_9BURK|nr:hypothetical protein [Pelomonas aquatica]MCY4754084.1 hypothetical protein [Pelomonas aquatica]MDG0862384.1 hypothetical protein [Pelomonas aquatica]
MSLRCRSGIALSCAAGLSALPLSVAWAAAPTNAPQVLLAITNSQSMDGTTSGAIMIGSGNQAAGNISLYNSSSPQNYVIPAGFTPPLNAGSGGSAPYTVVCGVYLCDNGPSRMNLAKAAIQLALNNYGNYLNFGLYTYSATGAAAYTTWVYLMSPNGGFTFTNTASSSTVANPCYQYSTASATVKTNCTAIAGHYNPVNIGNYQYMNIAISSDAPTVNDVYYENNAARAALFLDFGGTNPATPFPPNKTLANYNSGSITVTYGSVLPNPGGITSTGPTNAGYVPYSAEVLYSQRGFGYYAGNYSSTTGAVAVPMNSAVTSFNAALAPETNNSASSEVKAVTVQSPMAGLLNGANSYLTGFSPKSCTQAVVLLTDGLPTRDLAAKNWPPLGSISASPSPNGYGVSATFNIDGSLASTNDQALTDAINALNALRNNGIKTYIIGLGAGVNNAANPVAAQTLTAMAIAGGTTNFYPAADATSLNNAFLSIVDLIYKQSSVAAPIAPITVKSGTAFEYSLTSDPYPRAGYAKAYSVDVNGIPATTSSWDGAALMTAAGRTTALLSTTTSNTITTLGNIDTAAFSRSGTNTCVPDVATIVAYTINPSYTNPSLPSCSYLGDRKSNWFLGSYSTQNVGKFVGPVGSAVLSTAPGYGAYAASATSRPPLLMFANNDGFLYALNASSGALLWGWTPREVLPQLQNYSTFQTLGQADGNFSVVDAVDGGGNWGSYVVGSALSGAVHYSLKLNSNGVPVSQVYDINVSSGSSPGDKAGATGAVPLHQAPQFVYINGKTYAVFIVNSGAISTLYEVNVANASDQSSWQLPFVLSSAVYVDSAYNRLWAGSAAGDIWKGTLTGNAKNDALAMSKAASTINPANNSSAVTPILYVGYTEVKGLPYIFAANSAQITVYGLSQTGYVPMWATTTSSGYVYNGSTFVANATLPTLTSGGSMSDAPRVDGTTMILPLFVPPTGCGTGTGYYDFLNLLNGQFPTTRMVYNSSVVTANIVVGPGPAFTPSVTVTQQGVALNPGSAGNLTPQSPMVSPVRPISPISWKQH